MKRVRAKYLREGALMKNRNKKKNDAPEWTRKSSRVYYTPAGLSPIFAVDIVDIAVVPPHGMDEKVVSRFLYCRCPFRYFC
mmetsp:Transcript_35690/g.58149  ORF Transcript_35690/g.58149 Transcript_35690/m.58149 type:complete len:81 (+) Transcript_35690:431-673(+)